MDGCVDGWVDRQMDGWVDRWTDGQMDGWIVELLSKWTAIWMDR